MSDGSAPQLDLSAIRFPSDQIALGAIRKEQPRIFSGSDILWDASLHELNVIATITTEVELAQAAFAQALGRPDPNVNESRDDRISGLNFDYVRYGLSSGLEATKQLVRELENAAKEQANRFRTR